MSGKKKLGRRPIKVEFTCLHCGKTFLEHHLLSIDYCSAECRHHYHPKPTVKRKPIPVTHRKFYSTYNHAILLQLRNAQGEHSFEKEQGRVKELTVNEAEKIRAELKESYLKTNAELQFDVSHLSDEQINRNVDELFELLQSLVF